MRKYQWLISVVLIGCTVLFLGCEKIPKMLDPVLPEVETVGPVMRDTQMGDPSMLTNSLIIAEARVVNAPLPETSNSPTAPQIEGNLPEVTAAVGSIILLPFEYSGTNTLAGCIVYIPGVAAYYEIPYTGGPDDLPSVIPVSLSENVSAGTFIEVCYGVYDNQGQTSNFLNTVVTVVEEPEPEPQFVGVRKLYWGDIGTSTISSADPDGSNIQTLITGVRPWSLALDVAGGKIYWVSLDGSIGRANLDGSNVEALILQGGEGIGLDLEAGKLYWAGGGRISRANLDGSGIETLVTGLAKPDSMALDLVNRKVYWTDSANHTIQRANLDGSNVETLITGLRHPQGLNLDIAGGKMYWSNWPPSDKIQRANLDGSNIEDIAPGRGGLEGIVLDFDRGKMYWTDFGIDKIQRANFDGSNIEDIVTTGLSQPISITLDIGPIN